MNADAICRQRIQMTPFGALADGTPIELYTLRSACLEVKVITFGARIVEVKMLSPIRPPNSVVLAFDSLPPYIADRSYMGAVIGRYANRIAKARFDLNGTTYRLASNNGVNSLHGGARGFDQRVWSAGHGPNRLSMTYTSAAGEEGYPGKLRVTVNYSVVDNELRLNYEATATSDTPINLTNHLYFNLSGLPGTTILDHVVTLYADQFTPVDQWLIPTGEIRSVAGTVFDFREPRIIGERIDACDPQLVFAQGYDHNWVLRNDGGGLRPAAEVYDPASGRRLEVLTSEPGLQFYTGNHLNGDLDRTHGRRSGLCLETQHFPDSPNRPNFPPAILGVGATYRSQTTYRFSTCH